MSCAQPLSPRSDHLSFLPHEHLTPPTNFNTFIAPSTTRARSNTATSTGSLSLRGSVSLSAPTSPAGKVSLPQGLAPLSSISPISLNAKQDAMRLSHHTALPKQQFRITPSKPLQNRPAAGYRLPLNTALSHTSDSSDSSRITVRPRGAQSGSASSSDDTETEHDSDSTFKPGRPKSRQSHSQPDLTALRSWAGDVARGQAEERRVRALRKTPPRKSVPLGTTATTNHTAPGSPNSKSQPSLTSLRRSPSPRQAASPLTPLTPVLSPSSRYLHLNPDTEIPFPRILLRSTTGSSDADADASASASSTDPDSPSSGSITFSPKRRPPPLHARRKNSTPKSSSLGLTLSPDHSDGGGTGGGKYNDVTPLPRLLEERLKESTLFSLRLLAVVPALWGICVLLRGLVLGGWWVDVWPWGVDLTREALERLVAGGGEWEGTWKRVSRGDMIICIAWAACTAHFCFSLTTGLTHRWRLYYPLPSTLTRLLSLQCLCWPATYLTLTILGADRPLLAWVVIGITTGWSRTIQMWVTSNVPSARQNSGSGGDTTPRGVIVRRKVPPEGLSGWEAFVWGRQWDWDGVFWEVGWKVGGLLLVTTAWLFWKIENGWA